MDGILVVDKPQGITSHDVVDFLRRRFHIKKVGHAGTLDPMATGVLVMLIGSYTKASNFFMSNDKEYEGAMVLGKVSDTGDACGKITECKDPLKIDTATIENIFKGFLGEIDQTPPAYSAIKINGKKMYELARKGIAVQAEPRKITIKNFDIIAIALPEVSFRVGCSKGTYVRQLAIDIGDRLGCGAYLSRLRRTASGEFKIENAVGFDQLRNMKAADLDMRLLHPCVS